MGTPTDEQAERIHRLFESLRQGAHEVVTNLVDRVDQEIDKMRITGTTPAVDRVVGSLFSQLAEIIASLLGAGGGRDRHDEDDDAK